MKKKIAIYLAGTIKKSHEKAGETYWTVEDMALIAAYLKNYDVSFLNPAFRTDDLSDSYSVFGRDMLQVFSSNVVFVDARDRRGLGVGAEMMWAKVNKIPVVAWAPRNTHYRKDQTTLLDVSIENFIHPFVESLSDLVADDLIEGSKWIDATLSDPKATIKGIQHIGAAMQYYKEGQLHQDKPMQELLTSSKELMQRANRCHPQVVLSFN